MSQKLERTKVSPGNAIFFRNKQTGKIEHVGIALSTMQNGHVSMLDASSTTGKVMQRRVHVNSGFLIAALPFVSTNVTETVTSTPTPAITIVKNDAPKIPKAPILLSVVTPQKTATVIEGSEKSFVKQIPESSPVVRTQKPQRLVKYEPFVVAPLKAANDLEFHSTEQTAEQISRLKTEISKLHD